jgi:hypothetical protein
MYKYHATIPLEAIESQHCVGQCVWQKTWRSPSQPPAISTAKSVAGGSRAHPTDPSHGDRGHRRCHPRRLPPLPPRPHSLRPAPPARLPPPSLRRGSSSSRVAVHLGTGAGRGAARGGAGGRVQRAHPADGGGPGDLLLLAPALPRAEAGPPGSPRKRRWPRARACACCRGLPR